MSAVARPAQQAHTSVVSSGLLYPPAPTSGTLPFSQSLQARKERCNWWSVEDGVAEQLSKRHTVYKRRDGAPWPHLA